jgi:cytochrome P450
MTAGVGQSCVRRLTDLPSPRGLPLLGNALQIDPKRLHLILEEWSKVFGETYTISLGPKKVFVSSNPELLQIALRERPERYRRFSPLESLIREMRWHGVFSTEGAAWRPQRLLVVQALAATNLRAFFPTLRAITERLRRKWQRAADGGEIVEMTQELVRYTLDVTTALLFGEDPNTIERSDSLIHDHLAQVLPMLNARMNAPFPLWRYLKLPKDRRLDRSIEIVHGYIHTLIEGARRRMRDEPSELPRNLLEALLTAASEPHSGIDDELIVANVMTLLLAGEDTTAHTLAWTMSFLGLQPQLQLRLQTASVDALGDARVCLDFEDLKKLDLFEAAAHESMRMKPTIPMNFLEPVTDVVLGDVEIPAGTPLFFLLRPSMLNGKHFGKPEQFLPERWEAGHAGVEPHDHRAYVQFGAGPRVCPGRHLAGVELRLVLSMMLRNFSMQLACDEGAVKEVMGFTMMPSTMPVRLRAIVGR